MNACESSGVSVHHYADVLLNQPQLMFAGTALETVRHNSHPQFRFRSAGGTYPNPNNNVHVYSLAVAGIHKLITESLEINIDESVMNLLAKQLNIEVTGDEYGKSLMLLHKRSNEISNPSELLTTLKDATNRLDYSHKFFTLEEIYKNIKNVHVFQNDIPQACLRILLLMQIKMDTSSIE